MQQKNGQPQGEIKLKINDNELRGAYANQVSIMHSKNDFVLDFISMFPPEAIVTSRIILTPSVLKRVYYTIGQNLSKYEEQFGEVDLDDFAPFDGKLN